MGVCDSKGLELALERYPMDRNSSASEPEITPLERVRALTLTYSSKEACTAYLLCDRHDPARVAYKVVGPNSSSRDLSYADLRTESERIAAAFCALGIREGDRIATLMGKSREYIVTLMAIWRLGAVHVPLFTAFAPPAIAPRLLSSRCKLVVCDPAQLPKMSPSDVIPQDAPWRLASTGAAGGTVLSYDRLLSESAPRFQAAALGGDAPVIQIYTSGTTGTPKGVVVPLRALAGFQAYAEFGLNLRTDDVFWNAADPGWAYGLYFGVIATLSTATPSILVESGFSPSTTLDVLHRYGVTNFTAAPTVYRSIRASGLRPAGRLALRCASSAGEPLTSDVNEWAVGALGMPVHDHYGQTEVGMVVNNHHHPSLRRPIRSGSMGHSAPGWQVVVLKLDENLPAKPGERGRVAIDIRDSPLAWFQGYAEDPTRTAEKFSSDGRWYFTGDTGYVDDEEYLHFSARDDDLIIMAGYRIGPLDVESVLLGHPAVAECAVVAVPDEVRGELLDAVVVLREGYGPSEDLTADLQERVKRQYAAHAYPRHIHYVAKLPRTPSGKVQRYLLRRQLRAEQAQRRGSKCV